MIEITRTYRAKSEEKARQAFAKDQSIPANAEILSSVWTPGKRRTQDWIAAVFLSLASFGLGLIPVLLWLAFGRPIGTLTVSLRSSGQISGA